MNKFSWRFVLFYAAVFGWSRASDFSCAPNETFKNDCNTCVCSGDGKTALCDQRACLPHPLNESSTLDVISGERADDKSTSTEGHLMNGSSTTEVHLEQSESNNHVCTPDDVKMQDCNRCRCAANGIGWFCTRRACPPKGLKKRAVQSPLSYCVPGSRWNDGCNNCICTDNRIPICTLMHCFGLHENLRAKRSTKECTPGTTWKQDCNTCFCSETGFAACTLRGCISNKVQFVSSSNIRMVTQQEYESPEFRCEPMKAFRLVCNSCRCSDDGTTASWCTKKRCGAGE